MKTIALIAALFIHAHSWADIGTITEIAGEATIKRAGQKIQARQSSIIQMSDAIETRSGRVRIRFADNTTVLITESSSLIIDDFVYTPATGTGRLGLRAASGTVRYVSGAIAHSNPGAVKINTPTASISVRGTDFGMSVSESGASMIILMPSCEVEAGINLRGLVCTSGRIDVNSGGTTVVLDRPYAATLVETASAVPSAPVVVNLSGAPIGNGLMLTPPRTAAGASVVSAARRATEATGDSAGINQVEAAQTAANRNTESQSAQRDVEKSSTAALELGNKLTAAGVEITDVSNSESVYKIWRDSSQTVQTGWGYERVSPSSFNYVNIAMSLDSKALIVVTQDRVTDAYNSNMASSRSYGTIVINQSYR